jgi:DNA-binding SARP family transcriptional activator
VENAVSDVSGELSVRLLGQPQVMVGGLARPLPASRKAVMVLGYLAAASRPVPRSQLCDLLWDGPNDPRGELRWCLTKLRRLLASGERDAISAQGDHVALALADDQVDVRALHAQARDGLATLGLAALEAMAGRFAGAFLDGLQADRSPAFETWLAGQRRSLRTLNLEVLERLCDLHPAGTPGRLRALERRATLLRDDAEVHLALLRELAAQGDIAGAEAHLSATSRLFAAEGLDPAPLRSAWHAMRSSPRVPAAAVGPAPATAVAAAGAARRRPRVAIMPPSGQTDASGLADAVAHDVIARLARLRSLAVIAWGSVSALARRSLSVDQAATALSADYIAGCTIRDVGGRARLDLELIDAATQTLLWSETFDLVREHGLVLLDEVGSAVVASLSHAVELAERDRALVKATGSLTAWEAYHRGLWHMYQFTAAENRLAQADFQDAARLDPTFARAHAGISFTHWQNAFQRWGDPAQETEAAYAAASRSLLVDDLDPLAHWSMGRALWLKGSHGESLAELRRAIDISPSLSLAHYAIAFVQSQSGDPIEAIRAAEQARQLSPFDPLLFGTYGSLAMAHARLEQFAEAAEWGLLAVAQPNAHRLILAIAAHCLALAGRLEEASRLAVQLRSGQPPYLTADFLSAFHFAPEGRRLFLHAGRQLGLA